MLDMTQKTWIAGAVAAMFIAAAPALLAQDDTTAPAAPPMAMTMPPPMATPQAIDYKVLTNAPYSYADLEGAKRTGLSDNQIAVAAKIADKTGVSFNTVCQQILLGAPFQTLAVQYGLNLADLYNVTDEKQKISDYKLAYKTTGTYAMRMTNDTGMPYPVADTMDTSGSMAPAAPMAPAMPMSNTGTMTPAASGDVVDVAMTIPRLSTFVRAVQAAGLVDTLKGTGPFTIFAPDNAAFKKLPKGALKSLIADPTQLMSILEYHVISGQKIDAATAMSMTSPTSPPTVEGGTLNVTTSGGKVMINDATVVRADIQASNGIIHIINNVLMPPAP
jgi:uncharacterized surface protein with fasciclin (FAS1) repeats